MAITNVDVKSAVSKSAAAGDVAKKHVVAVAKQVALAGKIAGLCTFAFTKALVTPSK